MAREESLSYELLALTAAALKDIRNTEMFYLHLLLQVLDPAMVRARSPSRIAPTASDYRERIWRHYGEAETFGEEM